MITTTAVIDLIVRIHREESQSLIKGQRDQEASRVLIMIIATEHITLILGVLIAKQNLAGIKFKTSFYLKRYPILLKL